MSEANVVINTEKLQDALELLRALAHPLRIQILGFIDKHGSINVNKIYNAMLLEQSNTSQHLKVLRAAGVVITERDGKLIHYRIDYRKVGNAVERIKRFTKEEAQILV
jgi:DNA-binding transcriptional ArsR family regulator